MNNDIEPIKVRLVLKDEHRGWILEKFALRLAENLPNWGVEAVIAGQPSHDADVNHWIWYCDLDGKMCSRNTLFVTHVDRPAKLLLLKNRLKQADMAICMSRMTVEELIRRGIRREKICFITPAHDSRMKPRRIIIGITSQLRPDKAKREDLLVKLAETMILDAFQFEIIGSGWERIIPRLEAAGAVVRYFPGTGNSLQDYEINLERVPTFDYYLYLGFDEGSMGTLDALAAGVPTIITPQGFHLDIKSGITLPFSTEAQLRDVFTKLAHERQSRIDSVSNLTWNEYARQHAIVWRAILINDQESDISDLLHGSAVYTTPLPRQSDQATLDDDIRFYTNTNLQAFYSDWQMLIKLYTGIEPSTTFVWKFFKRLIPRHGVV